VLSVNTRIINLQKKLLKK